MTGPAPPTTPDGLGLPLPPETPEQLSPFRFAAPLAPAMAAKLEGRTLDFDAVVAVCRRTLASNPFTIVEGVGGSFVPMTDNTLVADWIAALALPSLLVTGSYLGTLSHTIATVDAMRTRGLSITAIIVSESAPTSGDPHPDLAETAAQIRRWCDLPVAVIPRLAGNQPWRQAPALTHLIPPA
jgi:dethiobiotin synthetase